METMTRKEALQSGIAFLYEQFLMKEDTEEAEKLLDLWEKAEKKEWAISFSGHFSAGKSTLINQLLDEELLPHSPIPTSANIVKITSGEPGIVVYFNDGKKQFYAADTDLETIQQYCRNGEEISRIDIVKKPGAIPDGVGVIDTPGIDSANDADRVITESSLHLVDLLVYVMDYNHVQSEVNLRFIQEMQKRNKPVYVVINQIDKHREEELSFEEFRTSVDTVFDNWNIQPDEIFFTSLMDKPNPHNQWEKLKQELNKQMKKKDAALFETVKQSTHWIMRSHFKKQAEQLEEKFADFPDMELEQLEKELAGLEEKRDQKAMLLPDLDKSYRSLVDKTVQNALLTPYEVREKAEAFLEAHQPHFKPGLFASKNKIERIRNERKAELSEILQEKITSNLVWKVNEKVSEFIKQNELLDNRHLAEVQSIPAEYDSERLLTLIKPGARLTPDYVLRYTDDVDQDAKRWYKHLFTELWQKMYAPLKKEINAELEKLNEEKKALKEKINQVQTQTTAKQDLDRYCSALWAGFHHAEPAGERTQKIKARISDRKKFESRREAIQPLKKQADTSKKEEHILHHNSSEKTGFHLETFIESMKQAEELFQDIHGFERLRAGLIEKRNRLESNHYTIALFGAFSAGKSSFANALLGEQVLPVSPNPTTAVINKISPPIQGYQHGTVMAKVKSESHILADLGLLDVEIPGHSLEEKVTSAKELLDTGRLTLPVREHAFLQAVVNGYKGLSTELGKEKQIDYRDLADYVAVEHIACYLEWTELYYDCPLTTQGISLVDTPGADSINSRHTDVAFDYIKQADAILFVTYYNHAFSKADRDFLLQLGRVKDSFSIDKMFFIINASDLAKNKEEERLVERYVANQLMQFGIRKPRMYSLSSKQGLVEKQSGSERKSSGLDKFEDDFHHFLHTELAEIMSRSAFHEIHRGADQLKYFIASASLEKEEKGKRADQVRKKQQQMNEELTDLPDPGFHQELQQKVEKQMFYVMERDAIQYNDRFKEFFNPTTVTGSGSDAKEELKENTIALLEETRHQLSQEVRAVSLRMERFVNEKASEYVSVIEEQVKKTEPGLSISQWEEVKLPSPQIENGLQDLPITEFNRSIAMFRNKKAFFEKNEKEKIKESVYETMRSYIEAYLDYEKNEVNQWYSKHLQRLQSDITTSALQTINEYYEGVLYTLTQEVDIQTLEKKATELDRLTT